MGCGMWEYDVGLYVTLQPDKGQLEALSLNFDTCSRCLDHQCRPAISHEKDDEFVRLVKFVGFVEFI